MPGGMMRKRVFLGYAVLLTLAVTLPVAGEAVRDSRWAVPIQIAGVENLHRVDEGLYRSGQPTAEGFRNLSSYGIRRVLSLRSNHDDQSLAGETGLELLRVPMAAWLIRDDDVIAALRILRRRDAAKPVLVHCWHGSDRTGLVIAAYRIVCQNWTVDDAVSELQNGGFGHHAIFNNITGYLKSMNCEKIRAEIER